MSGMHRSACAGNVRHKVIEEMLGLNVNPCTAQRVHLRITGVCLPPLIARATLRMGLVCCHANGHFESPSLVGNVRNVSADASLAGIPCCQARDTTAEYQRS